MTALQIRNLPDDVHRKLKARAAAQGQSLSDYAGEILRRESETMTTDEWLERVRSRVPAGSASVDDVVAIIRADRESR